MKKMFEEPIVDIEKFMMESVMNESSGDEVFDENEHENWTPIG